MRREPGIPRVPIRLSVTFCHLAVVVLVALPLLTRSVPPPTDVIQVSLLGLPGGEPGDGGPPAKGEEAVAVAPEPVKEEPAPEAVKDEPEPEPAKPEPAPEPEPASEPLPELPPEPTVVESPKAVPIPVVKPKPPELKKEAAKPIKPVEKPKEAAKPKSTIKPVPLPTKTEPAKPKTPEKSAWKPRMAEEIRKGAKLTTIKPLSPGPATPGIDAGKLADKIRSRVKGVSVAALPSGSGGGSSGSTGNGGRPDGHPDGTAGANGPAAGQYFALVSARLHELWNQPTRAAVGSGRPTVTVHVTVLPDGRVTAARVDRTSGVMPMDTSVATLLKQLDRLPAYRSYGITASQLSIEVVFELD